RSSVFSRDGEYFPLASRQWIDVQTEACEFIKHGRSLARSRRGLTAGALNSARRGSGQSGGVCRPLFRTSRCGAESKAAERVAVQFGLFVQLATMAVAAAMFLVNRDVESCAAGKTGDGLRALEHRAMLGIAPHRDDGRRPAALLGVGVNRVGDAEPGC